MGCNLSRFIKWLYIMLGCFIIDYHYAMTEQSSVEDIDLDQNPIWGLNELTTLYSVHCICMYIYMQLCYAWSAFYYLCMQISLQIWKCYMDS